MTILVNIPASCCRKQMGNNIRFFAHNFSHVQSLFVVEEYATCETDQYQLQRTCRPPTPPRRRRRSSRCCAAMLSRAARKIIISMSEFTLRRPLPLDPSKRLSQAILKRKLPSYVAEMPRGSDILADLAARDGHQIGTSPPPGWGTGQSPTPPRLLLRQ